jgi:hypothetical protein
MITQNKDILFVIAIRKVYVVKILKESCVTVKNLQTTVQFARDAILGNLRLI